ncbi:CPBP family intramembrane metalloprotease [Microcystis aeruginosa NIES-298]|uniref:Abortive infection protein like n=1 Tax=Microcystis aeruginosa NIES-298 TaxID=449468 RepID=A0A2H6BPF0_MICAE|nr:CPBP family intramembrane glutamic endopeptidase [Microcystis aeruginosa]QHU82380.1 CPBP family intramembrane metalloprotease [Microcystis aeruginosa NIES-298]GBD52074.1 abortive infection protein like [Microcystis aeruginosa NIES-298]GBF00204.1 CAAX protease family protein [Microcystis aeruginosa NIES-298]
MNKRLRVIATYPVPLRLGIFILLLLFLWLPIALPLYHFFATNANLVSILTLSVLYLEFLGLSHWWGRTIYGDEGLADYGLIWRRKTLIKLINGLAISLFFTFSLFLSQGFLGWLNFLPANPQIGKIILEGFLVALAVGFAEELLFRGWLLGELEKDYRPAIALVISALIFALAHFIKPLAEIIRTFPQFPALVLLGLILGWAKRTCGGSLGKSIGLHGGLIWAYYILNVGQLIKYTGTVPDWLTGIDKNPLAGVMGLLFLTILAIWIRKKQF